MLDTTPVEINDDVIGVITFNPEIQMLGKVTFIKKHWRILHYLRLSRYAEYETLFVGKAVKPDIIIINDPRIIQQLIKDIQAEEERVYRETGLRKLIGQTEFFPTWKMTAKLKPSWG